MFLKEEERGLLPGGTQQYHLLGSCALWPHLVCPSEDSAWHGLTLTLTQTTERVWRWRELCRLSAPTHLFLSRGTQRAQSDVVVTEHDGDRPGWEARVLSIQELSPQPLLSQKAKKQAVRRMASLRGSGQHPCLHADPSRFKSKPCAATLKRSYLTLCSGCPSVTKLLEDTSQGHNEGKLRGVRRIGHQRMGFCL